MRLTAVLGLAMLMGVAQNGFAHGMSMFVSTDGTSIEGMAYYDDGRRPRGALAELTVDGAVVATTQTDDEGRFRFEMPVGSTDVEAIVEAIVEVSVDPGDGHRASWRLRPDQLVTAQQAAVASSESSQAGSGDDAVEDEAIGDEAIGAAADGAAADGAAADGAAADGAAADGAAAIGAAADGEDANGDDATGADPATGPTDAVPTNTTHTDTTLTDTDTDLAAAIAAEVDARVGQQIAGLREELALEARRKRFTDILGGIGYIVGMMGLATYLTRRKG